MMNHAPSLQAAQTAGSVLQRATSVKIMIATPAAEMSVALARCTPVVGTSALPLGSLASSTMSGGNTSEIIESDTPPTSDSSEPKDGTDVANRLAETTKAVRRARCCRVCDALVTWRGCR